MKNKGLIATIVVMSAIIVTLIVVLLAMQMSSIVPIGGRKTAESVETEIQEPTTAELESEIIIESIEIPKLNAQIKTYTSNGDRIKINYPELIGLDDTNLLSEVNKKLYDNAISIVKLYPISTALQRLDISCDVKYINDDFITVVYEGRVVGDKAGGANTNLKGDATYNNSTSKSSGNSGSVNIDPYLDGFVDPLTLFPSYSAPETAARPVEVFDNNSAVTTAPSNNSTGTSDGGPTVSPNITPTSARKNIVSDYSATTNPTSAVIANEYTSNGIYNAPASSNGYTNPSNAPVYGQTGTSVSASTINQKIFYTNTIDLRTGLNVTLKDYGVDFEKLAKYARSTDVEFANIDDSDRSKVRSYINKTVLPTLTEQLENNSDFTNNTMSAWPKHFSYRDEEGNIYFTIKLSSRLGNYAIIKYNK